MKQAGKGHCLHDTDCHWRSTVVCWMCIYLCILKLKLQCTTKQNCLHISAATAVHNDAHLKSLQHHATASCLGSETVLLQQLSHPPTYLCQWAQVGCHLHLKLPRCAILAGMSQVWLTQADLTGAGAMVWLAATGIDAGLCSMALSMEASVIAALCSCTSGAEGWFTAADTASVSIRAADAATAGSWAVAAVATAVEALIAAAGGSTAVLCCSRKKERKNEELHR